MRLRTALLVTVPFVLACMGGDTEGSDTADGDFDMLADVECDPGEVLLSASSRKATAIEVEVWDGDLLVERVHLVHRGDGDWFASTTNEDSVSACTDAAGFFLFRGFDEAGRAHEESH